MHPQRITVLAGVVIGSYFFEDEHKNAETENRNRFQNMISNFLWPFLDDMDTGQMWLQQNSAICRLSHFWYHNCIAP